MRFFIVSVFLASLFYFIRFIEAEPNRLEASKNNFHSSDAIRNSADSLRVAWIKQYFSGATSSYATNLAVDRSGNVYVTGRSSNPNGGFDFLTIKYNRSGIEQWVARDNEASDFVDASMFVTADRLGNVYVAGSSPGTRGEDDYLTIKYNSQGKPQWVVRYNSPFDNADNVFALVVDRQCNVYMTGNSFSDSSWDYATIKYNASGSLQWAARFDGASNSWDQATALAVDNNGNVYVTGWSEGRENPSDYVTIKYSPQGVEQWIARYDNPGHAWSSDRATALELDDSGNVYVTGKSLLGDASQYYVTIKYNNSGREEWIVRYNRAVVDVPGFSPKLAVDTAGNVYVAGAGSCAGSYTDVVAIKYGRDGLQKWLACYNSPANNLDYATALAVDNSENVYVTGTSFSSTSSEFITTKYDKDGVQQWLARFDDPSSTFDEATDLAIDGFGNIYVTGFSAADLGSKYTSIKYTQKPSPNRYYLHQNYPNPFNISTAIRFEVPKASHIIIKIYDLLGREVFRLVDEEFEAGEYERMWSGEICAPFREASGVYFIRIQTEGFSSVRKLVLIK